MDKILALSTKVCEQNTKIQELEQQLQQAHRQGWEQAKREAVGHLRYQHNLVVGEASLDYLATLEQCWSAIASMKYKEVEG